MFYSGVAQKLLSALVEFLRTYLLPLAGAEPSTKTPLSSCFMAVPVSGDFCIPDSILDTALINTIKIATLCVNRMLSTEVQEENCIQALLLCSFYTIVDVCRHEEDTKFYQIFQEYLLYFQNITQHKTSSGSGFMNKSLMH